MLNSSLVDDYYFLGWVYGKYQSNRAAPWFRLWSHWETFEYITVAGRMAGPWADR